MAASVFQKFVRNQSLSTATTRRIIVSHLTTPTSAPAHHPLISPKPIQAHSSDQPLTQDSIDFGCSHSFHIYPSFSFWHFINPAAPGFTTTSEATENGAEASNTIWADSVKKKRKRKMNKHKLKKLRKSLRRKT